LIYAVVGLAATWLAYIGYVHIATRTSEGLSARPLQALFPTMNSHAGVALVYCFSPQCRPCRPMSLEVDRLIEQGAPLFKLDVRAHPELARDFGIRATPTLILIRDGVVSRMLLGVKTRQTMQRLIDGAEP
jgi:hypothetical protein